MDMRAEQPDAVHDGLLDSAPQLSWFSANPAVWL